MVDIGKTRLDLPWNAYYEKELDVRFSRSYGPGRYDDRYELEGVDYPAGYVRWTERRNLACFLDLLADGSVDVASLISGVHPVEEAADVYSRLGAGSLQGVGFLLSYGDPPGRRRRPPGRSTLGSVPDPRSASHAGDRRRGARWASSGPATTPRRCCCRTCGTTPRPSSSRSPRRGRCQGSTPNASSDSQPSRRASIRCSTTTLSTRYSSSRGTTRMRAWCARPWSAASPSSSRSRSPSPRSSSTAVLDTVERTGNDRVMVGFNRRFAPLFTDLRATLRSVSWSGVGSVPRQRRPSGPGQLVPQ